MKSLNLNRDIDDYSTAIRYGQNAVKHVVDTPKFIESLDLPRLYSEWFDSEQDRPINISLIQSALGTGKTTAVISQIAALQEFCRQDNIVDNGFIIISPRRVLSANLAETCTSAGIKTHNYETLLQSDYGAIANLAIVLNSIGYIKNKDKGYILVIDELHQCISQINSTTVDNKRLLLSNLKNIITNASIVIGMDADISVHDVELMMELAHIDNDNQIDVYINEFKPATDKFIYMYDNKNGLINALSKDIKTGKNIYICTNSINLSKKINEVILECKPQAKIKLINSETDAKETQDFIKNINNEVFKYDVVIASPSLTSGVSIDLDNSKKTQHFDAVYGLFYNNKDCGYQLDSLQQLARVRYAQKNVVWYENKNTTYEVDSVKIMAEWQNNKDFTSGLMQCFTLNRDYSMDASNPAIKLYNKLYVDTLIAKHEMLNHGRDRFIELAERQGYNVSFASEEASNLDIDNLLAAVGDRIELNQQARIIEANQAIISDLEYSKLKAKKDTSLSEQDKILGYELTRFYHNNNVDNELLKLDNNGKTRNMLYKSRMLMFAKSKTNTVKAHQERLRNIFTSFTSDSIKELDTKEFDRVMENESLSFYVPKNGIMQEVYSVIFKSHDKKGYLTKANKELYAYLQSLMDNPSTKHFLFHLDINLESFKKYPIRVTSELLERVGLTLIAKSKKIDGKTVRHYTIEVVETVKTALDLIELNKASK
jgi:hypothetical protein